LERRLLDASPWYQSDLVCVGPGAGTEYDYSEIVYFHSYVRDFLYGGDGKPADKRPMRVFHRTDIHKLSVDLDAQRKYELVVNRLEAYLFETGVLLIVVDIAVPGLEAESVEGSEIKFSLKDALDLQNTLRMVFPRRWSSDGKPSETPLRAGWLNAAGKLIDGSEQNFMKKDEFTTIVRQQAELPAAKHWQYLVKALPLYGDPSAAQRPNRLSIKQIEDQRVPSMTYLAVPNPRDISEWDFARIAFYDSAGESSVGSYSDEYLRDWDKLSAYDRFWQRDVSPGDPVVVNDHNETMRTRWLCSGYGFAVVGANDDKFYKGQIAANFGHHYFRMGLIAHFQRASLLTFRDQLAEATARTGSKFRKSVIHIQKTVTQFRARFWFHEVSTQLQGQEIFTWWSDRLGNRALFDQVTSDIAAAESQLRTQFEEEESRHINNITEIGGALAIVGFLVSLASLLISLVTADGAKNQSTNVFKIVDDPNNFHVVKTTIFVAVVFLLIVWLLLRLSRNRSK